MPPQTSLHNATYWPPEPAAAWEADTTPYANLLTGCHRLALKHVLTFWATTSDLHFPKWAVWIVLLQNCSLDYNHQGF